MVRVGEKDKPWDQMSNRCKPKSKDWIHALAIFKHSSLKKYKLHHPEKIRLLKTSYPNSHRILEGRGILEVVYFFLRSEADFPLLYSCVHNTHPFINSSKSVCFYVSKYRTGYVTLIKKKDTIPSKASYLFYSILFYFIVFKTSRMKVNTPMSLIKVKIILAIYRMCDLSFLFNFCLFYFK